MIATAMHGATLAHLRPCHIVSSTNSPIAQSDGPPHASALPREVHPGRMVRPMDALVAVDAASVVHPRARHDRRGGIRSIVMAVIRVALLTEAGRLHLEEALKVRAMGLVTVQAALQDGRMLPEKRPPLGGVAARAILVDGRRRDEFLGRRPVR